jgi:hypothetical protein
MGLRLRRRKREHDSNQTSSGPEAEVAISSTFAVTVVQQVRPGVPGKTVAGRSTAAAKML